jgi:hypothetical protein
MTFASTIASELWARITPGDPGTSDKYDLGMKRATTTPTTTPDQCIYFELSVDATGGAETLDVDLATFQTGTISGNITISGTPNASAAADDADGVAMNLTKINAIRIVAEPGATAAGQVTWEPSGDAESWTTGPISGTTEITAGAKKGVTQLEDVTGWTVAGGSDAEVQFDVTDGIWTIKVMVIGEKA